MNRILTDINSFIFDKMDAVIVFLIVAGGMYVVNIILGSVEGIFKKEFDWKKFFYGIGKALVSCLCILAFCLLLNLANYGLSLIKVSIPDEIITVGEILVIIWAWIKDLALDITEKIKNLKTLKYVKYDEVSLQDINNFDTEGLL